jgi:hypothetical protein
MTKEIVECSAEALSCSIFCPDLLTVPAFSVMYIQYIKTFSQIMFLEKDKDGILDCFYININSIILYLRYRHA